MRSRVASLNCHPQKPAQFIIIPKSLSLYSGVHSVAFLLGMTLVFAVAHKAALSQLFTAQWKLTSRIRLGDKLFSKTQFEICNLHAKE
jgi:hypothetical protein